MGIGNVLEPMASSLCSHLDVLLRLPREIAAEGKLELDTHERARSTKGAEPLFKVCGTLVEEIKNGENWQC